MKQDRRYNYSLFVWIASIIVLVLVYESRSALPEILADVLLLVFFVIGVVAGFSCRIYYKPRFVGLGLRDDKEVEEDERDMNEPYYHH
jgi:hypothetical protein